MSNSILVEQALREAADALQASGHVAAAAEVEEIVSRLAVPEGRSDPAPLIERWEAEIRRLDRMLETSTGSMRDAVKFRRAGVRACIEDLRRVSESW
jgi:hypothetical protein